MIDALHQSSCHRIERSRCATNIVRIADLLSLGADGVNLIDEQQYRWMGECFTEDVSDVLFRGANKPVQKTRRRDVRVIQPELSRNGLRQERFPGSSWAVQLVTDAGYT